MAIFDRFTPWAPRILSIFRILMGIMFACHGSQKLFGTFGGMPPGSESWMTWTAGTIEVFGGILIVVGLFTRYAAFLCSGLMAVAYFYGHARNGFWPKANGGELAIIYCWFFLYLVAQGPGAWALDNLWRRRRAAGVRHLGGIAPRNDNSQMPDA